MKRNERSRGGFTMVELLVVIGILLVLAGFALAVFNTGKSSDKMRSAARGAQSAFMGAKDRALHAKDLRGVRLTRDLNNLALVNGFQYIQPLPTQTTGMPGVSDFSVVRPNAPTNNDATKVQITGTTATTWSTQDTNGLWPVPPSLLMIRIPSQTGQWYTISNNATTAPYWGVYSTASGTPTLTFTLQTPYIGGKAPIAPTYNAIDPADANASCDIKLGNDVLPFHQPITLPSGCVIDLTYCSANVIALAGKAANSNGNIDILFSPRGMISGPLGAQGPLFFLIRGLEDATAGTNPWAVGPTGSTNPDNSRSDRLILAVFPQTGLIQTFECNLNDFYSNPTTTSAVTSNTGSPDGIADNLFGFAQTGQSAGR